MWTDPKTTDSPESRGFFLPSEVGTMTADKFQEYIKAGGSIEVIDKVRSLIYIYICICKYSKTQIYIYIYNSYIFKYIYIDQLIYLYICIHIHIYRSAGNRYTMLAKHRIYQ